MAGTTLTVSRSASAVWRRVPLQPSVSTARPSRKSARSNSVSEPNRRNAKTPRFISIVPRHIACAISFSYTDRFVPAPNGCLHFGSLVATVTSYLDTCVVDDRWLVYIEDLDLPREIPGAQWTILETLERYGFEWDSAIEQQSECLLVYAVVVKQLLRSGLTYAYTHSHKQPGGFVGIYPGFCCNAGYAREDAAIRPCVPELEHRFVDRVQGEVRQHFGRGAGDFVIQRRDGLYAHQLMVMLNDA